MCSTAANVLNEWIELKDIKKIKEISTIFYSSGFLIFEKHDFISNYLEVCNSLSIELFNKIEKYLITCIHPKGVFSNPELLYKKYIEKTEQIIENYPLDSITQKFYKKILIILKRNQIDLIKHFDELD